jgi:hypothetical protein
MTQLEQPPNPFGYFDCFFALGIADFVCKRCISSWDKGVNPLQCSEVKTAIHAELVVLKM